MSTLDTQLCTRLNYKMSSPFYLMVFILFFIQFGSMSGDECPDIYKRYSTSHSYCQPKNANCEILAYYLTEDDKQEILKLHNTYRSTIAMGKGKGPQVLPPAANMLQMEWDDELAAVSQKYAERCLFEHDCPDCRRVMNFGVGQNIAIQKVTGSSIIPQPDWQFAVSEWFSEIIYFQSENVCPFKAPNKPNAKEFRHFSQVSWADTFRVGCGYVLYTEGSGYSQTYSRLYYCNYGPQGNMYDECMYEIGQPCTHCPQNTCCGNTCYDNLVYPGLCKRLTKDPPSYPSPPSALFYCDFHGNTNCMFNTIGKAAWTIFPSLSGSYLEIVLNGGESSTITFSKQLPENASAFCISIQYRKGPTRDGLDSMNKAMGISSAVGSHSKITWELPDYEGPLRHQFSTFSMSMSYPPDYQVRKELGISFEVPPGQFTPQFFNIKKVIVTSGACQN